jgi:glutathione S-transferase
VITVYHMRGSRGVRILWTCEEMGLPYEVRPVNFNDRPDDFVTLNPSRTIPVMVDGDVVITESVAATQYIAQRYGPSPLVVQPEEASYPDYLQFLMLGEAGLSAPMTVQVATHLFAPADGKQSYANDFILDGFRRRMALLEARLSDGREFLVADRLTLADISVTFPLGVASFLLKLGDVIPPAVNAYRRRLYQREAFRRAGVHGG